LVFATVFLASSFTETSLIKGALRAVAKIYFRFNNLWLCSIKYMINQVFF
jgi:hypothetical protein